MRKLIKYITAPSQEYQSFEDDTLVWVGGGEQGVLFVDAIIGFEPLEPCDKGARTAILLITGGSRHVMGSVDEWVQMVMEPQKDDSDCIKEMVLKIIEANK